MALVNLPDAATYNGTGDALLNAMEAAIIGAIGGRAGGVDANPALSNANIASGAGFRNEQKRESRSVLPLNVQDGRITVVPADAEVVAIRVTNLAAEALSGVVGLKMNGIRVATVPIPGSLVTGASTEVTVALAVTDGAVLAVDTADVVVTGDPAYVPNQSGISVMLIAYTQHTR